MGLSAPPELAIDGSAEHRVTVTAHFGGENNCTFALWVYESAPDFTLADVASARWQDRVAFEFMESRSLPGGVLQLQHRISSLKGVTLQTSLAPFGGGIDILVEPVCTDGRVESGVQLPSPNLCFQVARAQAFASDPSHYDEFIGRCFLFTPRGVTFLTATKREKNTVSFPADDPRNSPPKAQLYAAQWGEVPPMSKMFGAGHSPDRFVVPVIGVVSRDGRQLVAVATKSADLMWQAYHDCVHNNPKWAPSTGNILQRKLRTRILLMENDVQHLMDAFEDFVSMDP